MTTTAKSRTSPHRNHVELTGRLSGVPQSRRMPSGDAALRWRLVVQRPPAPDDQRRRVDVLECIAWEPDVQLTLAACAPGDTISVSGALRRRFWRMPGQQLANRVEVEVHRARRRTR